MRSAGSVASGASPGVRSCHTWYWTLTIVSDCQFLDQVPRWKMNHQNDVVSWQVIAGYLVRWPIPMPRGCFILSPKCLIREMNSERVPSNRLLAEAALPRFNWTPCASLSAICDIQPGITQLIPLFICRGWRLIQCALCKWAIMLYCRGRGRVYFTQSLSWTHCTGNTDRRHIMWEGCVRCMTAVATIMVYNVIIIIIIIIIKKLC